MPYFMVYCYEDGLADKKKPPEKIEAKDELEAAEIHCGGPLTEGAKLGDLRAKVHPLDAPDRPKAFRRA